MHYVVSSNTKHYSLINKQSNVPITNVINTKLFMKKKTKIVINLKDK